MYPIDKEYYLEDDYVLKVYDLWELPKEMLLGNVQQFGIPTEFYIKDNQNVTPIQARYWEVNRWYYEKQIVDYDFLHALPNFKGYGNYTQLYLIELWEDKGDDGHTEQDLVGYVLTYDIKSIIKNMRREC